MIKICLPRVKTPDPVRRREYRADDLSGTPGYRGTGIIAVGRTKRCFLGHKVTRGVLGAKEALPEFEKVNGEIKK